MNHHSRHTYGRVSLALTTLLLLLAVLPVSEQFESPRTALGLVTLATALILADKSRRSGHGIDKAAAWLSLGMVLLWVLTTLVAGSLVGIRWAAQSGGR